MKKLCTDREPSPSYMLILKRKATVGHLGGSVSQMPDFSSGHNLTVCGFEPCVRLCADSSEPALDSVSPSLSTPALLALYLSLSQK